MGNGEEIIIAKADKLVGRIVPVAESSTRWVAGIAKGKVVTAPGFEAPLPKPVLAALGK